MKSLNSMKALLLLLGLLLNCEASIAANWFVRPNGTSYGLGNGTNWSNAWNGFAGISWGSVSCGDTIWVAGGSYSQALVPEKICSSGARLAIKRARGDSADSTSSPGWALGFDSTVHQTKAGIELSSSSGYVVISGRTSATGGANGWLIDFTSATSGVGINIPTSANNNTLEYFDVQGPGYITYSSDGRGVQAVGDSLGNTLSHIKIWNWESGIYDVGASNFLFEYLDISGIGAVNSASFHPNGLITWSASNNIVRYSKFHLGENGHGIGEGILFEQSGGASNWQIYGNIFYDLGNGADIPKVIQITSSISTIRIFNNTFATNSSWPAIQVRTDQGGACAGNSEVRNNLFYATGGPDSCGSMSNNLSLSSSDPSPFVNIANKDYHIVSNIGASYPRNAGTNLSSFFITDMDQRTFGADGAWDIGAYEYFSGSSPSIQLAAPANLRIMP
ncbi:MAG: hypothetical protein ACXVB1_09340 [Pseudobdellovibrionaceae bacterium]